MNTHFFSTIINQSSNLLSNTYKIEEKELWKKGKENFCFFKNANLDNLPNWLHKLKENYATINTNYFGLLLNSDDNNYTLLGDSSYPMASLIDENGAAIPIQDQYSLEFWLEIDQQLYFPNTVHASYQQYCKKNNIKVFYSVYDYYICISYAIKLQGKTPFLTIDIQKNSQKPVEKPIHIHASIRPYNNHSFYKIKKINYLQNQIFMVNHNPTLYCYQKPYNIICYNAKNENLEGILKQYQHIFSANSPDGFCSGIASFVLEKNSKLSFSTPMLPFFDLLKLRKTRFNRKIKSITKYINKGKTLNFEEIAYRQLTKDRFFTANQKDQSIIDHSMNYLQQLSLLTPHLLNINQSITYYFSIIICSSVNWMNQDLLEIYFANLLKTVNKFNPITARRKNDHLILICSLLSILENKNELKLSFSKKKLVQKIINLLLSDSKTLNKLIKKYCLTSSQTQINFNEIEKLFLSIDIINRAKASLAFQKLLNPKQLQKLHALNYQKAFNYFDWNFFNTHYPNLIHNNIYSSPLLSCACFTKLFKESELESIYNIYKAKLHNNLYILETEKLSAVSPLFTAQIAIIAQKLSKTDLSLENLNNTMSNTFTWPTLISTKTYKGYLGCGHDITVNALMIKTILNKYILEKDESLCLFEALDIPKNQIGTIVRLEKIVCEKGIISAELIRKKSAYILKLKIERSKLDQVSCKFPLKVLNIQSNQETITINNNHFFLNISNEWQTYTLNCNYERIEEPA